MANQGINRFANFLSDEFKAGRRIPGFKTVKPSIDNAYMGIRPKAGLTTAVVGGAMIYAAAKAVWDTSVDKTNELISRGEDVGNLSALSYDGVGNVAGGRRDLGATGDLVFGLHNMRRGR